MTALEVHSTDVFDPVSGELIDTVHASSAATVKTLVRRARDAGRGGWGVDGRLRGDCLEDAATEIMGRRVKLVQMLVRATGKTTAEAESEVSRTAEDFRYAAYALRVWREDCRTNPDGSRSEVRHMPVGVVAQVTPWNWPLLLIARDLAPALAAGATVILKPAPIGTGIAYELLDALRDAGVPAGVVGIATGGVDVARTLICDVNVQMVAFTGSSAAGREVYRLAANGCKRLLLELAGSGTAVILADADVAAATEAIVASAVATAGQMCLACRRVVVEREILDLVRERLAQRLRALRLGPPDDPASDLGPLISRERLEALLGWLDRATAAGGRLVQGGRRLQLPGSPRAAFFEPALIEAIPPGSAAASEETFGPILQLDGFDDSAAILEDLLRRPPGLCAAVWSNDLALAQRLAEEIPAGTVWINGYGFYSADMPSGGVGKSGLARSRGREGIAAFTELKHINVSRVGA